MQGAIQDEQRGMERMAWSIREWKHHIDAATGGNISTSTIKKTDTWQELGIARERAKAQKTKRNRGRRRARHRSRY
jgi:hypothetical protein